MSKLEVNTIEPQCGTTLTLGGSGDTVTLASGDVLEAVSDTASSLDVVCSYIDTISS